jgi:hypothetical protein
MATAYQCTNSVEEGAVDRVAEEHGEHPNAERR